MGRFKRKKTLIRLKRTISIDPFHTKLLSKIQDKYNRRQFKLSDNGVKEILNTIKELSIAGIEDRENDTHVLIYFGVQKSLNNNTINVCSHDSLSAKCPAWTKLVTELYYNEDLTEKQIRHKYKRALGQVAKEFQRQHPDWIVWREGNDDAILSSLSGRPLLMLEDDNSSWEFYI